jgi:hypothetical protein
LEARRPGPRLLDYRSAIGIMKTRLGKQRKERKKYWEKFDKQFTKMSKKQQEEFRNFERQRFA